ncbi:VOC family protein [Litoreibacter janthinus]|uniref:Catechol 2,3-dioxygenase n=1 Tax=Litoreibacter janthinus TaxID=670154 RepID=A0A1I6FWT9_9RHOB|nr:VOC family protein [Litoreibacter janthinus]SFR34409.1 Catechol 2,3-dioxygenase [Litoreibacter janthinus]
MVFLTEDGDLERGFAVAGLGEVAIRCLDFPAMVAFYRDVIGLVPMEGEYSDSIAFFRIADGVAGHTTVLALFDKALGGSENMVEGGTTSTLHHLALSLPVDQQDAVRAWYDNLGQDYTVQDFDWAGWRGIFTRDPDGNTVELVAYDASLKT